jgi:hypothetical protein
VPRLGLDLGESHAGRWIGNMDQVLAGGTLNLPSGELGFGLQRLVTLRTIEFEFSCIHNIHQLLYSQAQNPAKKYIEIFRHTFGSKNPLNP